VVALLVSAGAVAGVLAWGRPPPAVPVELDEPPSGTADSLPEAAPTGETTPSLTVHVSGAVARPGLVVLEAGGRVADAVAAAGGALPEADLDLLNLAAPLADGQQVVVPVQGATAPTGGGGTPIAGQIAPSGPVDLNAATMDQLDALPGVGPVLAQRIVAHRQAHGPFTALEDLLDVPGIGEGKLEGLRDLAVVR
jgi:competence protein ComEA